MDLPQQLADGLILRQATPADIDAVAAFAVRIHDDPSLGVSVRDLMRGEHPTTGAQDFVLVVDTTADNTIVAMAGVLAQTWAYHGITFGIGNPEFIATDPAHRKRGLMRAVMDGLHAVSSGRGDLIQAIQGLRWFYRQFGYEYALNPGPQRQLRLSDIPLLPEGRREPYRIRRITEEDIPWIMPLYRRQCQGSLITNVLDESIRRHDVSGYSPGSDLGDWTFAIVDPQGQFAGYFSTWADPWGAFTVKELATTQEEALLQALPSVLRFIQSQRVTHAAEFQEQGPEAITFLLAANHPAYEILDPRLGEVQSRQDWYIRVPDLPAFIHRIGPVLERRLADSALRGFTGELKMTTFQGGLRLVFDRGNLSAATDWEAAEGEAFHVTGFPPLVFLKLLFGYRSLEELVYAFPDCWADDQDTLLLNALFPKRRSWLRML